MPEDSPHSSSPHIESVRKIMLEQLIALRSAKPGEDLNNELKRSRGVSEISQTLLESARVEISYLEATNQTTSSFLDQPAGHTTQAALQSGITSITRHRLR